MLPGKYTVSSNFDVNPRDAEIDVGFSYYYFICFFMAVVGVLIKVRPSRPSWRLAVFVLEGTVVAVGLTVGLTYLRYTIFQELTTDADFLNAAIFGLIGGYFGAQIIESTMARFMRR